MVVVDDPKPFNIAVLPPFKLGGSCAGNLLENLRCVTGVQDDKSHTPLYPIKDFIDYVILDLAVCGMSPPEHNVGGVDHFVGKPVFRLVKGSGAYLESVNFVKIVLDCVVNSVRIDFLDSLVVLFVAKFVPDSNVYARHFKISFSVNNNFIDSITQSAAFVNRKIKINRRFCFCGNFTEKNDKSTAERISGNYQNTLDGAADM